MFKFLIIFCLAIYLVFKISAFFFRAGAASQQRFQQRPDNNNATAQSSKNNKKNFKEGEYVDYEEIK